MAQSAAGQAKSIGGCAAAHGVGLDASGLLALQWKPLAVVARLIEALEAIERRKLRPVTAEE